MNLKSAAGFLTASLLFQAYAIAQTTRPIEQFSVPELIDRLVLIDNNDFGVRTNILPYGNATEGLPQGLLRTNDVDLKPAEAMLELSRRGAAALPQLAAHLDDGRKTKAKIQRMFGGINYSAEYDRNRRTSTTQPVGVGSSFDAQVRIVGKPERDVYSVTVGDLCFNLIGEIVNRNFEAVRYQPTAVIVVNSPVWCPDLCAAVRNEWRQLTPQKHRELLIEDVVHPDAYGRDANGIQALARYYPEELTRAVQLRLTIPQYDFTAADVFARNELYIQPDAETRKKMITDFVTKYGPAYHDGLIDRLWEDRYSRAGEAMFHDGPILQAGPAQILADLMSVQAVKERPLLDAVSYGQTINFIESLVTVRTRELDEVVWDRFQKSSDAHSKILEVTDTLAVACVKYLAGHGHDADLLAYCRRRHAEVDGDATGSNRSDREYFEGIINLLESPPGPSTNRT